MKSKGRKLHAQAANARERGQFKESLCFNDQALFAYAAENDVVGFAEGIACRSLTLRVYANQHDSKEILTLAKYEMMGSVAIARESGNPQALAIPLYNLAEIQEDLGELSGAVTTYKKAVESMKKFPTEMHNRPSVMAIMKVHLYICEYKAGNKKAVNQALQALSDLEATDEPSTYTKDVWVSGGYMRLAAALRNENPKQARQYLLKAKTIIDSNDELLLRKQQWEKLSLLFTSL